MHAAHNDSGYEQASFWYSSSSLIAPRLQAGSRNKQKKVWKVGTRGIQLGQKHNWKCNLNNLNKWNVSCLGMEKEGESNVLKCFLTINLNYCRLKFPLARFPGLFVFHCIREKKNILASSRRPGITISWLGCLGLQCITLHLVLFW